MGRCTWYRRRQWLGSAAAAALPLAAVAAPHPGQCRDGADSSLHAGHPTQCNVGTSFIGVGAPDEAPGCCERPNVVPEMEAQILDYLLKRPGGNCEVIRTCELQDEIGIAGAQSSYDRWRAPADDDMPGPGNTSTGTGVEVSMMLIRIGAPSIIQQDVTYNMHFKQAWNDPRLRWWPMGAPQTFPATASQPILQQGSFRWNHTSVPLGLDKVSHVPSSRIWTPDTFFSRSSVSATSEVVEIDAMGNVLWVQEIQGKVSCDMDFTHFPFDTPVCWTDVQSFGHQKQVVQYRTGDLPRDVHGHPVSPFLSPLIASSTRGAALEVDCPTNLGVYALVSLDFENVFLRDKMGDWRQPGYAHLPGIIFAFHMQRDKASSVVLYIMRPFLATMVSIGACWLNPVAVPARAGAAIVLLLVQFNIVNDIWKKVPDLAYLTALDYYLLICIVVSCLNVAEYAFVNYTMTQLQKAQAAIDAANKRDAADVFYFAMCGVGCDALDIDRAFRKLARGDTAGWRRCMEDFGARYPGFCDGDLPAALAKEVKREHLQACAALLDSKGIDCKELKPGWFSRYHAGSRASEGEGDAKVVPIEDPGSDAVAGVHGDESAAEADASEEDGWWRRLCAAAAADGFTAADLSAASADSLRPLLPTYGFTAPADALRLELALRRRAAAARQSADVAAQAEAREIPKVRVLCLDIAPTTPLRVEQYYRIFIVTVFLFCVLVWGSVVMSPDEADPGLSKVCGPTGSGCCPIESPLCAGLHD